MGIFKVKIPHIFKDGIEWKLCGRCQLYQPLGDFCKNKQTWDGLHAWCSACRNHHQKLINLDKKQFILDEAMKRERCFYHEVSLPDDLICPDKVTRLNFSLAFDWDHLPEYEKEANISLLRTRANKEKIKTELDKCVLSCVFHHRLITRERS